MYRTTLPNGIRVVAVPLPHLHTATMAVFVRVGSRHETARTNGISHFLEHMLFRGTARHPNAYELSRAIEELGGTLAAATHVDFTVFQSSIPPEHLGRALGLVSEIFTTPTLGDMKAEKGIIAEEILEEVDERGRDIDVDNVARRQLFGRHPLGFKITGGVRNVRRFTEADVRRHLARHYVGNNIVVCVAGAIDPRVAARVTARTLGKLPSGRPSRATRPRLAPRRRKVQCVESKGSQADVRVSFLAFGERDRRRPALQMLSRVLDDGNSTRLHRRICDERGLAYDVFGALDLYADAGVLDVGASVDHGKAARLVQEVLALLGEVRDKGPTDDELAKAKRRWSWQLRTMLDSPEAMASFYGVNEMLELDESLENIARRVARVTAAEVRDAARAVVRGERLAVTCVGALPRKVERALGDLVREFE